MQKNASCKKSVCRLILNRAEEIRDEEDVEKTITRILQAPRSKCLLNQKSSVPDRVKQDIQTNGTVFMTPRERFRFLRNGFFEKVLKNDIQGACDYLDETVQYAATLVNGQKMLARFLRKSVPILLERQGRLSS